MIVKLRDCVAFVARRGVRREEDVPHVADRRVLGDRLGIEDVERGDDAALAAAVAISASVWTIAPRETLTKTDAVAHQVELPLAEHPLRRRA